MLARQRLSYQIIHLWKRVVLRLYLTNDNFARRHNRTRLLRCANGRLHLTNNATVSRHRNERTGLITRYKKRINCVPVNVNRHAMRARQGGIDSRLVNHLARTANIVP